MSGWLEENTRKGLKVYREHSTDVTDVDRKAVQMGAQVDAQNDQTGAYTLSNVGDEIGWAYWEKATRLLGSWSLIYPVVVTDGSGSILPIENQNLGGDATYAAKTVVTVAVTDDPSKVMAIDGAVPTAGSFGFVLQGSAHATHEQIFIPASATPLKVDWATLTNFSTKVYDVLGTGAIDPTNVGDLKDLFKIVTNVATIITDANFHDVGNPTRTGPLSFQATTYPALVPPPSAPYTVETKAAWDGSAGKWRWYTQIGSGSGESTVLARVRWVCTEDATGAYSDNSEAEILDYDSATDTYAPQTPVNLVWVTWPKSKAVQFETLGDNAIFVVRQVSAALERSGVTRALYEIVRCEQDAGHKITHGYTLSKGKLGVNIKPLSSDLLASPWDSISESEIKTTIDGVKRENTMPTRMQRQWNLAGDANFALVEFSDFGRGLPNYVRPIEPEMLDYEHKIYKAPYELFGSAITYAAR